METHFFYIKVESLVTDIIDHVCARDTDMLPKWLLGFFERELFKFSEVGFESSCPFATMMNNNGEFQRERHENRFGRRVLWRGCEWCGASALRMTAK